MPDGGMITTAHDLARLIDALIGGRLLSPPLLAAMMTPQGPDSNDVEQYGYGLELVVEDGAVTIIGHGAPIRACRRWSPTTWPRPRRSSSSATRTAAPGRR
jgi:CubicO group peptidase (beta-lactamase class C family)